MDVHMGSQGSGFGTIRHSETKLAFELRRREGRCGTAFGAWDVAIMVEPRECVAACMTSCPYGKIR